MRSFCPFLLFALVLPAGCASGAGSSSSTSSPSTNSVQIYETTADGTKLLAQQTPANFSTAAGAGTYTIQVTPATVLQPWDGVGAAMTDSAATVLGALPAAQQQAVLQQIFSSASGVGFNMVRLPMGASDMSASGNYSYDDVAAGQTDPTLASFSIAHDTTNIIPLLKTALAANANLKLIATPWSPPAWMKTNASMKGVTNASISTSQIVKADFPYLANYFVDFIKAYAAQGLTIYAVSSQNEPQNTTSGYPSTILTAADEATFIASNLGPALSSAGLNNVKIFGLEDNWANTTYAQTLLQSTGAQYMAGTAFHWYSGTVSAMTSIQALNSSRGVWFTEGTETVSCPSGAGSCPTLTASTFSASGFKYQMQSALSVIQNSGRSVLTWNLALNQNEGPQNGGCYTCVGVVTVNSSTSPASIYYNNTFYAYGQIGKFVMPGANLIGTTSQSTSGIQDAGFQNPDGSIVLVVLNNGSSSTVFTVSWNGKSFDYTLPGGAAATFYWSPS